MHFCSFVFIYLIKILSAIVSNNSSSRRLQAWSQAAEPALPGRARVAGSWEAGLPSRRHPAHRRAPTGSTGPQGPGLGLYMRICAFLTGVRSRFSACALMGRVGGSPPYLYHSIRVWEELSERSSTSARSRPSGRVGCGHAARVN